MTEKHDDQISRLIEMTYSSDVNSRADATKELRDMLWTDSNREEIIQTGVVAKLVESLLADKHFTLQVDACRSLISVAAGTTEEIKMVVDAGAVPILIKLISCQREDLQELAVWALRRIIGRCPEYRDLVLNEGIIAPLLRFLWTSERTTAINTAVLALFNLCRDNKPAPDCKKLSPFLSVLPCMLFHNDDEIIINTCWVLFFFTELPGGNIGANFYPGVYIRVVELLTHPNENLVSCALKVLNNFAALDTENAQLIIDLSVLPKLLDFLNSSDEVYRRLTCQLISEITKGTKNQKRAIVEAGIIPVLIYILDKDGIDAQKSAAVALTRFTFGATGGQLEYIVKQGCIPPLVYMLTGDDPGILEIVLNSLGLMLRGGEIEALVFGGYNARAEIIKDCKGLDKIVQLKNHTDESVKRTADVIVNKFFSQEFPYPGIIHDFENQV